MHAQVLPLRSLGPVPVYMHVWLLITNKRLFYVHLQIEAAAAAAESALNNKAAALAAADAASAAEAAKAQQQSEARWKEATEQLAALQKQLQVSVNAPRSLGILQLATT